MTELGTTRFSTTLIGYSFCSCSACANVLGNPASVPRYAFVFRLGWKSELLVHGRHVIPAVRSSACAVDTEDRHRNNSQNSWLRIFTRIFVLLFVNFVWGCRSIRSLVSIFALLTVQQPIWTLHRFDLLADQGYYRVVRHKAAAVQVLLDFLPQICDRHVYI